ncbi:MAG: putative rane protein [Parachlamydiales bacterium]|nr:putative rane protein [Parachlamydiales bacterium]
MRLIFFLFILFTSLDAEIFQIKSIEETSEHLQEDTLVIFDLDNTVMEPMQTLGSDQWFAYRINEYRQQGCSDQDALKATIAEYVAIQNVTKMRLVEPSTFQVIEKLQKNHVPMIGLTTRSLVLVPKTIEQLNSIGVDFSKTTPVQMDMFFENDRYIQFQQGILFTSGTSKGAALLRLVHESGYQPKRILFVDDKMSHLQDVEKVCSACCIEFVGFRYGYLDEKTKSLRTEIARKQLELFGKLLSDEEAVTLLKKG